MDTYTLFNIEEWRSISTAATLNIQVGAYATVDELCSIFVFWSWSAARRLVFREHSSIMSVV